MKKTVKTIAVFVSLIGLVSCGGADKTANESAVDSTKTTIVVDSTSESQTSVLYNMPSPMETFTVLKMAGGSFDKGFLNPSANISKYTSSFAKSINLGTYSADLSFCLLYKQNQDINIYLKNVNQLTSELDIDGNYVQTVAQRVKVNSNNLDSIVSIVSEATVNANMYLKENQRDNTTALITAGGWLEGLYFITSIANKTQKKEIISLVAEQKSIVKNLVKELEQFQADAEIASLVKEIKVIAYFYETLKPVQEVVTASAQPDVVSIGNNTTYELSKEQLKNLLDKVAALRNKLTI
jgi:hypothetical protein